MGGLSWWHWGGIHHVVRGEEAWRQHAERAARCEFSNPRSGHACMHEDENENKGESAAAEPISTTQSPAKCR